MPFDYLANESELNYDANVGIFDDGFCNLPLLTKEDPTLPVFGADWTADMAQLDHMYGVYQTVRTGSTFLEAEKPVLPRAMARSREVQMGIDEIVTRATSDGELTHGEAKWSVDSYGRAFTFGVCYWQ